MTEEVVPAMREMAKELDLKSPFDFEPSETTTAMSGV